MSFEYTKRYSRYVSCDILCPLRWNLILVKLSGLKTALEEIEYQMDKDDHKDLVQREYLEKLEVSHAA